MKNDILKFSILSATLTVVLLYSGCDEEVRQPFVYTVPDQPEPASGYEPKPGWEFSNFAVAAANPLATDAGYQIIRAGGSAVDAAIAVQMVLTLVEPQSSGIGGGAFLLARDGEGIYAYDGRETAPAAAGEDLFLDENGEPLSFAESVNSGLSVGVPGTLAMLYAAHQQHGLLDWSALFEPAITLAEQGFPLSPRLNMLLEDDRTLRNDDIARALYYDEQGNARPVGYILKNPALADVLRQTAREGIETFYTGAVAESIVERVRSHNRPGLMTVDDLRAYPDQDFRREPMCSDWRAYRICGFPPPSSGHIAIMQMLGIMDNLEPVDNPLQDSIPAAAWLHNYLEAAKLAFADRALYLADPAFTEPPGGSWYSLLDDAYLSHRAALIGDTSMGEARPGEPVPAQSIYGQHPAHPEMGTSHISIVDRDGNAVAMTTTIEQGFGSRIMSDGGTGLSGGFHLNNELTDFSRIPVDEAGHPIANRVEPGKRPRSSMSPTLILDREGGTLAATLGSPGGAGIIHYTAKTIIGMFDWGLNAQEAINLPNFTNLNGPSNLETGRFPEETIRELETRGHLINQRDLTSGLQAIQRTEGGYFGGADPRREGIVKGQ